MKYSDSDILNWLCLLICFIVSFVVIGICIYLMETTEEVREYTPVKWESEVRVDNMYIPEYGERGMKIRDNVNVNFDKISIVIEELNKRVKLLESER